MPFIKVSFFSYIVFFIFCMCCDLKTAVSVFISVAVHETGHIVFILLSGDTIREIRIDPFGLTIKRTGSIDSYKMNMIIYLAGPLFNFLLSAVSYLSGHTYISEISLFYGAMNLLPVSGFDGGKVLSLILQKHLPFKYEAVLKAISGSMIFILWTAAVFVMLKSGDFVSLFFVCLYLFFVIFP